jgi:tetratricopeptide (TPR) repeat protein
MPTFRPTPTLRRLLLLSLLAFGLGARHTARADEFTEVQRLYESGQAAAAIQRAEKYLSTAPKDPQMRFLKGVMLADAKREMEAIALFQKLVEDHPDLAKPYNNLAALYAGNGDYARARATLEQALKMSPGYATAHENLGDVYAALAAQSYSRALKLDPLSATASSKLAVVRGLYKPAAAASAAMPIVH